MTAHPVPKLVDGATCRVTAVVVRDINVSRTGHMTITVQQDDGARFKTLARNVVATEEGR